MLDDGRAVLPGRRGRLSLPASLGPRGVSRHPPVRVIWSVAGSTVPGWRPSPGHPPGDGGEGGGTTGRDQMWRGRQGRRVRHPHPALVRQRGPGTRRTARPVRAPGRTHTHPRPPTHQTPACVTSVRHHGSTRPASLSRGVDTPARPLCRRPEEPGHPRVRSTLSPGPPWLSVVITPRKERMKRPSGATRCSSAVNEPTRTSGPRSAALSPGTW